MLNLLLYELALEWRKRNFHYDFYFRPEEAAANRRLGTEVGNLPACRIHSVSSAVPVVLSCVIVPYR